MKTPSRPMVPPLPSEDDIRAYAEHLYEQSGRVPNRDLDNWLEAKACLEANIARQESHLRLHHHLRRRHRAGAGPQGFTMPPSDASLWIAKEGCAETNTGPPPAAGEEKERTGGGDRPRRHPVD